jgi:hypothetical protein
MAEKNFGTGGAVASFPTEPEIKEAGTHKDGTHGWETEAEAKAIHDKLNEVIKTLKSLGLIK